MTSDQHRVDRLRLWLTEFDGKISSFCRMYGLPRTKASYLSQVLSGNRTLGERAARTLEAECNRPAGWLDMQATQPTALSYDVARFSQLPEAERKFIEDFIEFVLHRNERQSVQSAKAAPVNVRGTYTPSEEERQQIVAAIKRPRRHKFLDHDERKTTGKRHAA